MKIPGIFLVSALLLTHCNSPQKQAAASDSTTEPLKPVQLRCEYLADPQGIDKNNPRLAWQLFSEEPGQKQTAYHLLVASSPQNLNQGIGDLWDSGKVVSNKSNQIEYEGNPLESRRECFWKVMIWDKDSQASAWSDPASWSMGLLDQSDWQAMWIGSAEPVTSPFYRSQFQLRERPEKASIYIAALGYFEIYVNGKKIGEEVLAPAVVNFSKRTYYRTYDLTDYLEPGNNILGVWMGTGWYSPGLPGVKHHSPVLRAQLEIVNPDSRQTLCTDLSWETKPSERKLLGSWRWGNFGGEQVDGRAVDPNWCIPDRSSDHWSSVVEVEPAEVPCSAQACEGNRTFDRITPQTVEWLDNETVLLDYGTNLTGMMSVTFRELQPGQKISLYYADLDGRNEEESWRALMTMKDFATYNQWDEYVGAGKSEEKFENVFNYHAFRYVLVDGLDYLPEKADFEALPVETSVTEAGTFSCSNDLFNNIHEMVSWTYRCLNLGGQTVDCPHRERLGYGDGQTIMETGCFNFDAASLYAKWSQNWWDEQLDDGFVPFTAPSPHSTGGGPAWGAMCIMVPWKTYIFYEDLKLLREGYPVMKKYMNYLNAYCQDGILQDIFPGEKWPNLGDWVPPRRGMDKQSWVDDTSRRFFNNCYRLHLLQIMQEIAVLIDLSDEAAVFENEICQAQKRIHEVYYNPEDSTYANGEQPYLIFPLKTGVTPDSLRTAVFTKYQETLLVKDQAHLNTGMIGTQIMIDYLLEQDRNDLIDTLVNQRTYPGWGYMIEKGATTCWEQWNGYYSQIHSCFPYIGSWFYKGLGGIQPDIEHPGFKNIILKPGIVNSVDWVNCSYKSPYGKIVSNWKTAGKQLEWHIQIPPNSTATVYIPGRKVRINGKKGPRSKNCSFLYRENACNVYQVESGNYLFTSDQ